MPLYTNFIVTDVLAGSGSSVSEASLELAPATIEYGSVRLPAPAPRFDFALTVQGRSMEHADIQNRDVLLCRDTSMVFEYRVNDRVVIDVSAFPELIDANKEWRCLRLVEEINNDLVRVSSSVNGKRVSDLWVNKSDIVGIVVRAYSNQDLDTKH